MLYFETTLIYDISNNSVPQNISRLFRKSNLIHFIKLGLLLHMVIFIFNIRILTNNIIQLHAWAPEFGIVCHPKYANCQNKQFKKKVREILFAIFHPEDTHVKAPILISRRA